MDRVFVSSTSLDLIEHRKAVQAAILSLGMHPVMMEHFPAMDADAVSTCRQKVISCDRFVGIYAYRYGYIPEGETRSITELEYEWASTAKIPRYIFVVMPGIKWSEKFKEHDKAAALNAFKKRLSTKHVWAEFDSPDKLAAKVSQALAPGTPIIARTPKKLNRSVAIVGLIMVLLLGVIISIVLTQTEFKRNSGNPRVSTNETYTPLPTPLEGTRAGENEIVIALAPFEQTSGSYYEPHKDISETIELISEEYELDNVRVITIGHSITSESEANSIANTYSAEVVIYGRVAPGGITVHYDINPVWHLIKEEGLDIQISFGFDFVLRISRTDVTDFESYLYEGVDVEYILGITTGFASFFQEDFVGALNSFSIAERHLDNKGAEELDSAMLYLYLGSTYYALEEYKQAIHYYDQAMLSSSEPVRWGFLIYYHPALARYLQGFAYLELEQYEDAISSFTDAIELMPDRKDRFVDQMSLLGGMEWAFTDYNASIAYSNRATAFFYTEQYEKAITDFTQAITLNSGTNTTSPIFDEAFTPTQDLFKARSFHDRGLSYLNLTDYENAEQDFRQAISLDPENADNHYLLGRTLFALQQHQEAAISFSQAISLDPENADYHCSLGRTLFALQQPQEAVNSFSQAISLDPENADYHYLLGQTLFVLQQPQEAVNSFSQAISYNYEPVEDAHILKGLTLILLDEYEQAIQSLEAITDVDFPGFVEATFWRGAAYFYVGEFTKAISEYKLLIDLNHEIPHELLYYLIASSYLAHSDHENAIFYFTESIAVNPTFIIAYNQRGNVYRLIGETDLAVADYTTTIETEAENILTYSLPFTGATYHILQLQEKVEALRSRGQIFYDKGELELAYSDWQQYVSKTSEGVDQSIIEFLENYDLKTTSSP